MYILQTVNNTSKRLREATVRTSRFFTTRWKALQAYPLSADGQADQPVLQRTLRLCLGFFHNQRMTTTHYIPAILFFAGFAIENQWDFDDLPSQKSFWSLFGCLSISFEASNAVNHTEVFVIVV